MERLEEAKNSSLEQPSPEDGTPEDDESGLTPNHDTLSPKDLDEQLAFHYDRFQRFGELEDIGMAIEYATRALELTPDGHSDQPTRHAILGVCYTDRFQLQGEVRDLERAIEHKALVLELTTDEHPDSANRHANLGDAYMNRFRCAGELNDLEKAIEHGSRSLGLTPNDHPHFSARHATLGAYFSDRFQCLGKINDLERAIEHESDALELTPDDHPNFPDRHTNIGVSYGHRFQRLGELCDFEMAIKYGSRALELTPDAHPDLADRHANIGAVYTHRFRRVGELHDLEKAIEHGSRALELTPNDHPHFPSRHANLGACYSDRFQRLGEVRDLEKAIEHGSRAVELTPDSHPKFPARHANLGAFYINRFQRLGEINDLEKAIEHKSRALASTPDSHPELPDWHGNIGASYSDRFHRLGEINDLEKAIEHGLRALELTPNNHLHLPRWHSHLGSYYKSRFWRLGEMHDIGKAIEHQRRALESTLDDHPDFPARHANLGSTYNDRFQRVGGMQDIEKAIQHNSRAFQLTPVGHPDLPDRHGHLGVTYMNRFRHLGEMNDLEKAVEHYSSALELTPDDHPLLLHWHADIGVSYNYLFNRLSKMADLDKAIEHKSRALELAPDGHPHLPDWHANLGVSYSNRFKRLNEMHDLEKAIEHDSRALELTPNDHPHLPLRHLNLAVTYNRRFQRLGEINDFEKMVEHESYALALLPDGHPDLPTLHSNWASTCIALYQQTGDPSYLNASLDSYRKASQLSTGAPRIAFQNAFKWAMSAADYKALGCLEAFKTTMELLSHFIWLGASTTQRYEDLSAAENLATNAAHAAILESNLTLALEWLEHARCVVWNQTLMLRSPLDKLQSSHPDLAVRLQTISKQLHNAANSSSRPEIHSFDIASSERVGQNRRRLAQDYHNLIAEARTLPKFENFLQPMKVDQLVPAARNGPIVVINCHENRCDALLVLPGEDDIRHLPLPNFTAKTAQDARLQFRMVGLRERGVKARPHPEDKDRITTVLLSLWNDIIKPVLDFLGYTNPVSTDKLPHITWCPTGPLSFLPLHAAGDYSQPHSRVFNYAISSYTPTLTALLPSSSSIINDDCQVLAIGQKATPGQSPLPSTAKELECVKARTQYKAKYSELIDEHATKIAVLDAMEQHDWIHLACHAHQNIQDPTKSGFFLQDGTLDLASINQRLFKRKGLAFLSACQTATGDEKLPDEVVHLASGMLMAGYTSVIGTMWSVRDGDAPVVADKVYAQLMEGRTLGNGEAGRALHNAVGELRDKIGEKEFGRWMPYIHIGS